MLTNSNRKLQVQHIPLPLRNGATTYQHSLSRGSRTAGNLELDIVFRLTRKGRLWPDG